MKACFLVCTLFASSLLANSQERPFWTLGIYNDNLQGGMSNSGLRIERIYPSWLCHAELALNFYDQFIQQNNMVYSLQGFETGFRIGAALRLGQDSLWEPAVNFRSRINFFSLFDYYQGHYEIERKGWRAVQSLEMLLARRVPVSTGRHSFYIRPEAGISLKMFLTENYSVHREYIAPGYRFPSQVQPGITFLLKLSVGYCFSAFKKD